MDFELISIIQIDLSSSLIHGFDLRSVGGQSCDIFYASLIKAQKNTHISQRLRKYSLSILSLDYVRYDYIYLLLQCYICYINNVIIILKYRVLLQHYILRIIRRLATRLTSASASATQSIYLFIYLWGTRNLNTSIISIQCYRKSGCPYYAVETL